MKGLSRKVGTAALLVAAALLPAGCGETNNFGGSVDIEVICPLEQGESASVGTVVQEFGDNCVSNPTVSMGDSSPVFAILRVVNRMQAFQDNGVGQHARLYRMDVEYRTPNGARLPDRREQLGYTVNPRGENTPIDDAQSKITFPVTLISAEQIEYITNNRSLFPDYPFQISLRLKLFYDTSGGMNGSVERLVSVQATP